MYRPAQDISSSGSHYQNTQDAKTNHERSASNWIGGYPEKYVSS